MFHQQFTQAQKHVQKLRDNGWHWRTRINFHGMNTPYEVKPLERRKSQDGRLIWLINHHKIHYVYITTNHHFCSVEAENC
jgi:hypothetical protein